MSRFNFTPSQLQGVVSIQRIPIGDNRGFFSRFYCENEFEQASCPMSVCQINHSFTRHKGTLRGLHFQHPPHAERKLVSCIQGEVFDVAVDLRADSPTFLQWHGEILSAQNQRSLYIPKGFAHGFQTLTDDCELIYLHSTEYQAQFEDGLNAHDARLNIDWPLSASEISARDQAFKPLSIDFKGLKP